MRTAKSPKRKGYSYKCIYEESRKISYFTPKVTRRKTD